MQALAHRTVRGNRLKAPTIYIDQNILGFIAEGSFPLAKVQNVEWVYSNTHFSEFSDSEKDMKFVNVLDDIRAVFLELKLDSNFNATETALLHRSESAAFHYTDFKKIVQESDVNPRVFDEMIVALNGGGLNRSAEEVADTTFDFLNHSDFNEHQVKEITKIKSDYIKVLSELEKRNANIVKTRKKMGISKSGLTGVSGDNILEKVWRIIEGSVDVDINTFFGFSGEHEPSKVTGITRCCAVMDVLGFHSERKCRKVDRISNVLSDSQHIANASFCSAIISNDEALVQRAKAIYEYLNISTKVIHYMC